MTQHNFSQHNNEEQEIEPILTYLADAPQKKDVESSFRSFAAAVTNSTTERILKVSPRETTLLSSFYMNHIQKILGLSAAAIVVVLVVGYFTVFKQKDNYDDILSAAIDDPSSYETPTPEDSFADLTEQDPVGSSSILDGAPSSNVAVQTGQKTAPATPSASANTSIEGTLSDLDTLFASDDINDTDLQTWASDTSASDALIQDYTI